MKILGNVLGAFMMPHVFAAKAFLKYNNVTTTQTATSPNEKSVKGLKQKDKLAGKIKFDERGCFTGEIPKLFRDKGIDENYRLVRFSHKSSYIASPQWYTEVKVSEKDWLKI